jgi:hypothetical protein
MSIDQFFSFEHLKREYFLIQNWNHDNEENFLKVILTDCTNYWSVQRKIFKFLKNNLITL